MRGARFSVGFVAWVFCHLHGNVLGYSTSNPPTGFQLKIDGENEFKVIVADQEVLSHTKNSPIVYIGNSELKEKLGLGYYYVKEDGYEFILTLHDGNKLQVKVHIYSTARNRLVIDVKEFPGGYDSVWIRMKSKPDEQIFGGGAQYEAADLKGRAIPIWSGEMDPNLPRWTETSIPRTLFPLAVFMSSKLCYFHIKGYNYAEVDFTQAEYHEILMFGKPMSIHYSCTPTMLEAIRRMSYSLLRRQHDPPTWLNNGAMISVDNITNVNDILQKAKSITTSVVWISNLSLWDSNDEISNLIDNLRSQGVHVLGTVDSCVPYHRPLYQVANDRDFFVRNNGHVQSNCDLIDLSNPEAFHWFKGIITSEFLERGFSGWYIETANGVALNASFHNGESGVNMHNRYTYLLTEASWEVIYDAEQLQRISFFTKTAAALSSRYNWMSWIDGDDLRQTLSATLSLGMSGLGLSHFDITTGSGDDEMIIRRAELAAFGGTFRLNGEEVLNLTDETLHRISIHLEVFRVLAKYTKLCLQDYRRSGFPLQRPLYVHYDRDPTAFEIHDQFLFGEDLLVAPVLEVGARSRKLYLPAGDWINLYDSALISGPLWTENEAPLGKMPVFYRKESPWQKTFQEVADLVNDGERTRRDLLTCERDICDGL
ncbi:hypothetical protein CAPTEDRAFT_204506 [Capitella teleta]|uniref:Glycoside hydrolase family 31 N-terminal domain-containing protein n=1 Tax=Capitella teleta TaxID=283909 RepID=R7TXC2_CAPTE|nr:hypothetical protein CAPTEDRAFT_204506 [Capitella teleta]|eukprot:ELT98349.1 hypothetical protein CAPTEDRAFT_204506 [Capitella teleta]